MSLKVNNVSEIMEKYAPLNLKESYDNVGLMVGSPEREITSILVCLDCTDAVIEEALKKSCNLIVSHHPLLFHSPKTITTDTLLGRKIIKLIKNDVSLYSSHTNLDSTSGGLNDLIMKLLGFDSFEIIEPTKISGMGCAGIGRISDVMTKVSLNEMCLRVKKALGIDSLRYCGDESMVIRKVAVVNGSGKDYFEQAVALGANCIITGDTTYHYASDLMEEGIALIDAGHYETEWPCMKFVAETIKNEIEILGFSNSVIVSESCRNPYKYK